MKCLFKHVWSQIKNISIFQALEDRDPQPRVLENFNKLT